jgi:hypothetical protein
MLRNFRVSVKICLPCFPVPPYNGCAQNPGGFWHIWHWQGKRFWHSIARVSPFWHWTRLTRKNTRITTPNRPFHPQIVQNCMVATSLFLSLKSSYSHLCKLPFSPQQCDHIVLIPGPVAIVPRNVPRATGYALFAKHQPSTATTTLLSDAL